MNLSGEPHCITVSYCAAPQRGAQGSVRVYLRRARKASQKLLARIRTARSEGALYRAFGLQSKFLHSYQCRLAALADANAKLPASRRLPLDVLPDVAATLDPWEGTDEEVIAHAMAKGAIGFRPILKYGIRNRALQLLAARALEPFASLHQSQFLALGKGRNEAARAVMEAIEDGYRWAIELDIENCYGSFKQKEFPRSLPMPRRVAEVTLTSTHLSTIIPSNHRSDRQISLLCASRRGLPQGSSASPLVAAMLLAPILACLPSGARVVNWGDNFLVLGRTKAEVSTIRHSLGSAVRCCHVGWLRLRTKSGVRRACDGFEFLGYWFRWRDGRASARPTEKNRQRFVDKCRSVCVAIGAGRASPRVLRGLVQSWIHAFECWDRPDIWVMVVLGKLVRMHFPDLQPVARRAWI